ncbi:MULTISPECIES: A24 family peptidase [unclassified Streptococcus]|uniref:prepilin peptidase n=1 Tax=unclassified Streptococcus TaxID=2608887 RepID=UPI000A3F2539|nr:MULTISPECIES: A24 family peptidase [unclassified Streptococcus]
MGSFLGVVIDRFPERSILFPASHCNHCKRPLKAWDLIPIISQLSTRSKCRYCGLKFSYWYLLLEATAGLLVVIVSMGSLSLVTACVVLAGTVISIYDIKHREYPFLVWAIFTALAVLLSALNLHFLLFLFLAYLAEKYPLRIGSGDLLYLASLSLIFPIIDLLWIIQISSVAGIFAIISLNLRKSPLPFIPFLVFASLLLLLL